LLFNTKERAQQFNCFYYHSTETEFDAKLKELQDKHQQELAGGGGADEEEAAAAVPPPAEPEPVIGNDEADRLKKQEKARRKKEAKKEKERLRQEELEEIAANAGPSMRKVELEALETQLKPVSLTIAEIPSDGNCLYRAVAAQCEGSDYVKIRK
jgi:OTU domain-containing protein 6